MMTDIDNFSIHDDHPRPVKQRPWSSVPITSENFPQARWVQVGEDHWSIDRLPSDEVDDTRDILSETDPASYDFCSTHWLEGRATLPHLFYNFGEAERERPTITCTFERVATPNLHYVVLTSNLHHFEVFDLDPGPADWLDDALEELREAVDDMLESGCPEPTNLALSQTTDMLRMLAERTATPPMIDFTRDGGFAIDFRKNGNGVLLICEGDGQGVCIENINGEISRARSGVAETMLTRYGLPALERLGVQFDVDC